MTLLYAQRTGALYQDGVLLAMCYAGHGDGLNNPAMQAVHSIGPLPVGWYTTGAAHEGTHLGPHAIPLDPDPNNQMFGRAGFYIHADNAKQDHSASEGCIVVSSPAARLKIAALPGTRLQVVEEKPQEA